MSEPSKSDSSFAQEAIRWGAIGLVLLVAFTARVVTSARSELAIGDSLRKEDAVAAVVHYRRAARFYAPLSAYHVEALDRLAEIGEEAERLGDVELALSAFRAVRSGILSARSVYIPERERLSVANRRIADLMAAQPPPPMDAGKSRQALRAEHLALLEAVPGPHVGWTLVLLVGFFSWVTGAFMFTQRAIDPDDRLIPRQARLWGAVVVVGLGMFVVGLRLA